MPKSLFLRLTLPLFFTMAFACASVWWCTVAAMQEELLAKGGKERNDQTIYPHRVFSVPLPMRGVLAVVLAHGALGLICFLVLRRYVREPMEWLQLMAERMVVENFREVPWRAPPENLCKELSAPLDAFGKAVEAFRKRIGTAEKLQEELRTVFESMVEAVIVIDAEERLMHLNSAAAMLLSVIPRKIRGRNIIEIARNIDLQRFIRRALAGGDWPIEGEIVMHGNNGGERFLQAHGVRLKDRDVHVAGVVVVLSDVTRMHKLEQVRRDFVANVSHELKTPITSIKGFAETLLDGGMEDHKTANHFLGIIRKQADRLNAIVEDLLTLARIEMEEENAQIVLEQAPVAPSLRSAIEICMVKATGKNITMRLVCDDGTQARINAPLLEQAVTNLVINAIKYSEADSEVIILVEKDSNAVRIKVEDHGVGIAAEHIPRLFERFYRSDKARSRKLGGTGLGLAIVKHIVNAHHGKVGVTSTPGKGSIFTITLPRDEQNNE